MEKLSNRALISRLYQSANQQLEQAQFDINNWSEWYKLVQGMTGFEKMVYVMVKLNQSVTEGGFANFYNQSLGIFSPEIIYVLKEINAGATADIVSKSLTIVNPDGLLDDAYKSFVFKVSLSEQQKAQLYGLDIQYDQLDGHENLEDLLGNYLQEKIN